MLYPIFKGTFDRYSGPAPTDPIAIRDYVIMWRKDLGRAIDYLQRARHRPVKDRLYGE